MTHPAWKDSPEITRMAKYIWWKSPGEAMEDPERVVAQVMNIGDYNDVFDFFSEKN